MASKTPARPLPPFSEALLLPPFPGHPQDAPLAVVKVRAWEPASMACWGYLVALDGPNTARVIGCLEAGGAFWPCDGPLASRPQGRPPVRGVSYRGRRDGEVEGVVDGEARCLVGWEPCRGGGLRLVDRSGSADLGPWGAPDAGLDFRAVVAGGALAWEGAQAAARPAPQAAPTVPAPRPASEPAGPAPDEDRVLDVLIDKPLPDALDEIVWRGRPDNAAAGPLARYAARSLELAGAAEVRGAVARTGADVVRLASTRLWWMRFPPSCDPADRDALLSVEAALNRVQLVLDRAAETPADDASVDRAGFAVLEEPQALAEGVLDGHASPNPMATFRGTTFPRGGEWDVRTRMARACERLRLPFRLEYRFDVDLASGVAAVEFGLPKASWFPASRVAADGSVVRCDDEQGSLAALYGLRLAAVLAACAFGSTVAVTRCVVTAFDGGLGGDPVLSASFGRLAFSHTTLPALAASAGETRPDGLARALGADVRLDLRNGVPEPVEPHRVEGLGGRRGELWLDHRPLSPELSRLVRADAACDLDVYHNNYPDELEEARAINREEAETPVVAIMRLEELCDRVLERLERDAGDLQGLVPLWSNSSPVRMLVGMAPEGGTLLTGVGAAADPLGLGDGAGGKAGDDPRYYQLPDAFFEAKDSLSHRYADLGEFDQALACADQCVALAPSSIPPRINRAVLLGDHEDFAAAATELKAILSMLVDADDTAFCLYRLAFAYWRLGKPALGAAAYVLAARTPRFADQARVELTDLLRESGLTEPTAVEAEALLGSDGVTLPPARPLMDALGEAGARLVDEGIPMAAWRPLDLLAGRENNDDLHAVAASLRDGTPSAYL